MLTPCLQHGLLLWTHAGYKFASSSYGRHQYTVAKLYRRDWRVNEEAEVGPAQ